MSCGYSRSCLCIHPERVPRTFHDLKQRQIRVRHSLAVDPVSAGPIEHFLEVAEELRDATSAKGCARFAASAF